MKNFWERIRDMYLNPAVGVPAVVREGTFPEAFRIVMVAAVVTTIAAYGASVQTEAPMHIGVALFMVCFTVIMWVFEAAVSFVVAKSLGGRGEYRTLLMTNGYATYMSVVLGVIEMFLLLIRAPGILSSIIETVLCVWMFIIGVIVLREVMHISTGKAIAVTVIPIFIIVVITLLLVTAYVAGGGQLPG